MNGISYNKITQKKGGGYLNLSVGVELFTAILLAVAILYFLLFAKNREWYVRFWGLCWIAYSISLILLILHMETGLNDLLSLRKIFDLANILLLLFGAYAFMHREIPTFWYRFGLYVVLWFSLGLYAGNPAFQYPDLCHICHLYSEDQRRNGQRPAALSDCNG